MSWPCEACWKPSAPRRTAQAQWTALPSRLPPTAPAAGSKYVVTKWEAKDRKKHEAGKLVKSRNEPCCIAQVLEVVAGHRGIQDQEQLAQQVYDNARRMLFGAEAAAG